MRPAAAAGITLAALLGLGVLFVAAVFAASEAGGEIVTLRTTGADGAPAETRLWVVEDGGFAWLRAGVPTSGWLLRIDADPAVEVERGGRTLRMRAVPVRDPAVRDRIHALMRERYGWADVFVSLIRDGNASVPVRLEPVPAHEAGP